MLVNIYKVKIALGSKEVLGYKDYRGTGFVIEGTAKYLESGSEFEMIKEKFSFLTRVLDNTMLLKVYLKKFLHGYSP